ncbi:mesenchyme-specific cell surface glycoprotein-like [Mytilus californianus]|uniref:mesenchyme-specific cell surface glycoprotein-like n=1 Tax=Mytilus californianus TaxID=6549 RepID=UPI0022468D83|nr:mesenchyme-specific cell surface glycoprotein-like [Mytilus californianus]
MNFILQKMKALILIVLHIAAVLCQFKLNKLSYTKLPYTTNNKFGLLRNAAHQAAYHAQERLLYVLGSQTASNEPRLLHIIDASNPSSPSVIHTHEFSSTENGRANDIAVCPDSVAVSLDSPLATKEGHVEMFVPFRRGDSQLVQIGREPVGVNPKGLAFTSDCQKLVIANEGRGDLDSVAQQFVDPPGTVSILLRNDIGTPALVTINFERFLGGREAEYQNKGVRWVYQGNHNAGVINKMSDDLEPDQVTISNDQRFAYVSLPENNAVARIDINSYSVNEIFALGIKNWTLYNTDCSDQDGGGNLVRRPIYSMYQATDIDTVILNGQEYVLSANQGVIKRYAAVQGDTFDESRRARTIASDGEFDESSWTSEMSTAVRNNQQLGRWQVRYSDNFDFISRQVKNVMGYGGRSMSLWQTQTMSLAFDTGDELETQEFQNYPTTFNGEANNGNQSPLQQVDQRSDDHGPEPTAVASGLYGNNLPIVVVGTRTGLIHMYSDDLLVPRHQSVHREGMTTQPWNTLYTNGQAGDAIITDIGIINANESPNGQPLVWVIGSATGSVGMYQVQLNRK